MDKYAQRWVAILKQHAKRRDLDAIIEDRKFDLDALATGIKDTVNAQARGELSAGDTLLIITTALRSAYILGMDDQREMGDLSVWEEALE